MGKNACGMGINMILDVIVEDKKKRLVEHKAAVSEEEMKQKALQSTRKSVGFAKALTNQSKLHAIIHLQS